jgi:hypothetical protein
MLTSLDGGRDLRQQRPRAPRPAARLTTCHVRGGYRTGHHVSALATGIRLSAGHLVWGGRPPRYEAGADISLATRAGYRPDTVGPDTVRPEAADGQSAGALHWARPSPSGFTSRDRVHLYDEPRSDPAAHHPSFARHLGATVLYAMATGGLRRLVRAASLWATSRHVCR